MKTRAVSCRYCHRSDFNLLDVNVDCSLMIWRCNNALVGSRHDSPPPCKLPPWDDDVVTDPVLWVKFSFLAVAVVVAIGLL